MPRVPQRNNYILRLHMTNHVGGWASDWFEQSWKGYKQTRHLLGAIGAGLEGCGLLSLTWGVVLSTLTAHRGVDSPTNKWPLGPRTDHRLWPTIARRGPPQSATMIPEPPDSLIKLIWPRRLTESRQTLRCAIVPAQRVVHSMKTPDHAWFRVSFPRTLSGQTQQAPSPSSSDP